MALPADARMGSVEVIYRDADGTELARRTMRGVEMEIEERHILPDEPYDAVPPDEDGAIKQFRPVIRGLWTEVPE